MKLLKRPQRGARLCLSHLRRVLQATKGYDETSQESMALVSTLGASPIYRSSSPIGEDFNGD